MKLFRTRVKRKEDLRSVAVDLGLLFFEKDDYGYGSYFKGFKLFGQGGGQRLYNLILNTHDSTAGLQYGSFDYTYVISTGTTTMVFTQTVFFWLDKSAVLPQFYLFPEKWYHKWAARLGMQDLDFKSYPEFSDKFVLQSKDPDFTSHIFRNDVLIETLNTIPEWTLESEGYYTLMYVPAKQQKPGDIAVIFERGNRINGLLRS